MIKWEDTLEIILLYFILWYYYMHTLFDKMIKRELRRGTKLHIGVSTQHQGEQILVGSESG
jgi:hypothetical protein